MTPPNAPWRDYPSDMADYWNKIAARLDSVDMVDGTFHPWDITANIPTTNNKFNNHRSPRCLARAAKNKLME